jgi:HlyD family secretion protein
MKRRIAMITIASGLAALAASAVYARRDHAAPQVVTGSVTRGSIVSRIASTGTVEAVTTVAVGSQVSGIVESLGADFNSIVKKGQVLARLDPALIQSSIEQARANLVRAQADTERLRVALVDAETKLARARALAARQLLPASDLDTSIVTRQSAAAQVRSAEAQELQARAALRQVDVNLEKTVITSPIDGIVISRNVDLGQTVSASMSAPTLFVIAADMTQMQINASVDESDLGRIADGQPVTFTVDAYRDDTFTGRVEQIRLNPVVVSNVVTYAAIVSAPNPGLKLKPGMTANLSIEVARKDDVLRVPAAALRVRPDADVLKAFGQSATVVPAPTKADSSSGIVWQVADSALTPVRVKTGATDGTVTEILDAPLVEGAPVITRVSITTDSSAGSATRASSPLMPSPPPRRF